jgi:hypothetical protein
VPRHTAPYLLTSDELGVGRAARLKKEAEAEGILLTGSIQREKRRKNRIRRSVEGETEFE